MIPSSEQQVQFLQDLQRLLNEGEFTATYKYALLLALADLSVELGDDSGSGLRLTSDQIAEKLIDYYWRQAIPYPTKSAGPHVLKQNSGRQAAIVRILIDTHAVVPSGGPLKLCDRHSWTEAVREVAIIVEKMPLWKLQRIAGEVHDFLYANLERGSEIELRVGVAFCFRRFYGLVTDLVRGAWIRRVRLYNAGLLDDVSDLQSFLFGSERKNLAPVRTILTDLQRGACFYCSRQIHGSPDVDHFIAWSRYHADLGHNFVLAHKSCNSSKADHLAAVDHLARWDERNHMWGEQLKQAFEATDIPSEPVISARVAHWAYSQGEGPVKTWLERDRFVPLPKDWDRHLSLEFVR